MEGYLDDNEFRKKLKNEKIIERKQRGRLETKKYYIKKYLKLFFEI
ncbi:hypothetical protein [Leptotrichia sp. oral taxon 879]|uniref:Uncharacterized protein n=1 Tax=Leptotrichia mesophila TaxID=3239303 RepID=A0AB39VDH7_9FUSO|nr:hypothetical protein [Leptotrichia sp. oral taxon 879]ERK47626.1 hypothetical protein HMPREF1552_02403 [Leptotrichia sp. oral taxon 879 str. F0557]